jgi:hypothetical protein
MSAAALRRDPGNALDALANRARRTSAELLVGVEITGLVIALAIWIFAPDHWILALPFLAMSAFAVSGVIDQTIVAAGRRIDPLMSAVLRSFRVTIVAAAIMALAIAGYIILGRMIGTVIS